MSDDGHKTVTASAISYKKRSRAKGAVQAHDNSKQAAEAGPDSASQATSQTPTPTHTPVHTPNMGDSGTRKISSRRKALQDYYKLQTQGETGAEATEQAQESVGLGIRNHEASEDAAESEESQLAQGLASEDSFYSSLKKASIQQLLRARNQANNKLNHHDSEKKAIIYDNYSDLIKLNDVLNDINKQRRPADAFDSSSAAITNQDVDAYLDEFATFLKTDAAVFNQDFAAVVNALCDDTDGAESIASMKALSG